ncbi:MAG: hypothetical protein ABW224_24975 [Kibdelosporangium sp.]
MGNEDHVQNEVDRLGRSVAEAGERATAQVGRSGPIIGEASSADNAITVAVSPGGMLRAVDLMPTVLGRHPDEVANEVLRLAAQATRIANGRMHASLGSVVSPDTARGLANLGMPAEKLPEEPDHFDGIMR